jgi:hypothetical protein
VKRAVIHESFPFTLDEVAAAWILHGVPLEEAQMLASSIARCMPLPGGDDLDDTAAPYASSGIQFVRGFDATIELAADIHAGGSILNDAARAARLNGWQPSISQLEVEPVLDRLAALGSTWAEKRGQFRELILGKLN